MGYGGVVVVVSCGARTEGNKGLLLCCSILIFKNKKWENGFRKVEKGIFKMGQVIILCMRVSFFDFGVGS